MKKIYKYYVIESLLFVRILKNQATDLSQTISTTTQDNYSYLCCYPVVKM
jgi:hypothetical protein